MRKRTALATLMIVFTTAMLVNEMSAGEKSGKPLHLTEKEQTTWNLDLPMVIFDDSIGDWVVDRFAGNNTAGSRFYQGPAREVGGLQRPGGSVEAGDGTVYMTIGLAGAAGAAVKKLVKVTPDGILRLVMEENGAIEGPIEFCEAGVPIWNPKEKEL